MIIAVNFQFKQGFLVFKALGFMKRNCAGVVNREALLRLYHSLVRSHVCFCSEVWAPQSAVNNLFLVESIQRRASRFIVGKGSDLSYRDRLIKLRLLPLNYWLILPLNLITISLLFRDARVMQILLIALRQIMLVLPFSETPYVPHGTKGTN